MAVRIRGWHLTDVGCVRELNEDAGYADPRGRFFICSDGMGGHAAGDVASQMAIFEIASRLDAWPPDFDELAARPSRPAEKEALAVIEIALRMANASIHERGQADADKRGMGCTADVVVIAGDQALCGHVGDSRQYLIRGGEIRQLTEDHSFAPPTPPGAPPAKGKLTSALGPRPACRVDTFVVPLLPGDHILMCTDGLADYFPDPREIASVLAARGDEVGPPTLIEMAKQRGGADNITIVMFRAEQPLELPLPSPVTWAAPEPVAEPEQPITLKPPPVESARPAGHPIVTGEFEEVMAGTGEINAQTMAAARAKAAAARGLPPEPAPAPAPIPEEPTFELTSPEGRKRMATLVGSQLFEGVPAQAIAEMLAGVEEVVLERGRPASRMYDGSSVAWLILEGARNGHLIYPEDLVGPEIKRPATFSPFSNVAAIPITRDRFLAYGAEEPEHRAALVANVERIVAAEAARKTTPRK